MLLNAAAELSKAGSRAPDWSSLRVLFTGGEAVPYQRAAEFEEQTGACVLQFYGSNETGALSRTALSDTREKRLRTAGRVIEEMQVRLFDEGIDQLVEWVIKASKKDLSVVHDLPNSGGKGA